MSVNLVFWIWLNVGVPVVGPFVTLALAAPTHGLAVTKQMISDSIHSGQLLWTANALAATTIYEGCAALLAGTHAVTGIQCAIGICSMVCLSCSTIVTLAALKEHASRTARRRTGSRRTKGRAGPGQPQDGLSTMLTGISIFVALFSATISIALHTYTT